MEPRKYWPFPIPSSVQETEETRLHISFFQQAHQEGYKAYSEEGGALGAVATNGRDGELIHRGKGRYWEVILGQGNYTSDSFYVDGFEHAAEAVLRWLRCEAESQIRSYLHEYIVRKPGQRGW